MEKRTDGERLAVVETEINNVKTEVKEIKDIVKDGFNTTNVKLDDAAKKLDDASTEFVPKAVFDSTIAELKRKSWQQNTLSAILGAVLSLLIAFAWINVTGG